MSQSGPFRLDLEDGNVVISRESPNNAMKMCHITRGGVRDVVACADIRFIEPMHVSQTYNCDDDEPPCAILSLRGKRVTLVFNHWKDLRCLFEEVKDAQRARASLGQGPPPSLIGGGRTAPPVSSLPPARTTSTTSSSSSFFSNPHSSSAARAYESAPAPPQKAGAASLPPAQQPSHFARPSQPSAQPAAHRRESGVGSRSSSASSTKHGHTVAESTRDEEAMLQAAIALSQQDHDVVQHNADRRGSSFLPSEEEMDNYRILGEIGAGGQGSLFKGQTRNGAKEFVVKKLKCETTAEKEKVEVWALQFMTAVSHPNIIRYLKVEVPSPKEVIICMPMYKEGDLEKYIAEARTAIPERTVVNFVKQIASALKYLHTFTLAGRPRPMLHRDIKPGNVLLSQNKTKCVLIDFDSWGRTGVADREGTLEYMAPEAIAGKECEPAVDIFSLGIILYVLLALPSYPMLECNGDSFVLGAADWERHPDKLRSALKSSIRQRGDYGDDIQELCLKMLAFNPAHRPTAEYVETTLKRLDGRLKAIEELPGEFE